MRRVIRKRLRDDARTRRGREVKVLSRVLGRRATYRGNHLATLVDEARSIV